MAGCGFENENPPSRGGGKKHINSDRTIQNIDFIWCLYDFDIGFKCVLSDFSSIRS